MKGLILVFLFCIVYSVLAVGLYVIKGDPVTFPGTGNSKKGATLSHHPKPAILHLVAQWEDGVWQPAPDYRDRMSPNESVILNSSYINDEGLYELNNGSGPKPFAELHVVSSTNQSVSDGDPITFDFFSVTKGRSENFTVERNGELVFGLNFSSGVETYGAGYEGRVSISLQWRSQGDLTVTLKEATWSDQGDYFLYVQDTNGRMDLTAVRVKVTESNPDPTTSPPPPTTQKPTGENGMSTGHIVTTAVAVVLAVALIVVLIVIAVRWFRSRRSNVSSRPRAESSDVELPMQPMLTEGGPPGSQVNGGPSRFNAND